MGIDALEEEADDVDARLVIRWRGEGARMMVRMEAAVAGDAVGPLGVVAAHPALAPNAKSVHTSAMSLKNAAFLALIGTLLLTIMLAGDFIDAVLAVVRGLIPAMALLRSLVYLFASLTVTVFFYVFNRAQSR